MDKSQGDEEDGRSGTSTSTPVVFLLSPPLKPVGWKVNLLDLAVVSNPIGDELISPVGGKSILGNKRSGRLIVSSALLLQPPPTFEWSFK